MRCVYPHTCLYIHVYVLASPSEALMIDTAIFHLSPFIFQKQKTPSALFEEFLALWVHTPLVYTYIYTHLYTDLICIHMSIPSFPL